MMDIYALIKYYSKPRVVVRHGKIKLGVDIQMKGLCSSCDKRGVCRTLCPEAEAFASSDYVPKRHTNFTDLGINQNDVPDIEFLAGRKNEPTKRQLQIYNLHKEGMSSRQIGRYLDVDDSYIRKVIRTVKSKL